MDIEVNSTTHMDFNFDKEEREAIKKTIKLFDDVVAKVLPYGNTIDPSSASDGCYDAINIHEINDACRLLEHTLFLFDNFGDIEVYDV